MHISSGSHAIHWQSCSPPMKSGPYIQITAVHAYQKPPSIMPIIADFMVKPF